MAEHAIKQKPASRVADSGVQTEGPRQDRLTSLAASLNGAPPVQRAADKTGLPSNLKRGIESMSGLSMDHVRVHYNSPKPASLSAHAYAQGNDIHVGPGEQHHLPHEAWHIVQQAQGRVRPTAQLARVDINDDPRLEAEADIMGRRAAALPLQRRVSASPPSASVLGVLQAAWVETEEAEHATQKWDTPEGGVVWYNDGTDLWYRIPDIDAVDAKFRADFQAQEGYQHRRSWDEWNRTSVKPALEWLSRQVRGKKIGETDESHRELLRNFQSMYGRGVQLWSMLNKAQHAPSHDADTLGTYLARYNTAVGMGQPSGVAKTATGGADGFRTVDTASKGSPDKTAYSNYVNPRDGIIVADHNYADKDADHGDTPRLNNSEILYHQYKAAGGALPALSQIIRSNLANQATMKILTLLLAKLSDRTEERTWLPGSPQFFALLGTENVRSAAFILAQHREETGGKTITSIVTRGDSYIKINIG